MFKYYLIHNLEDYRKQHMFELFEKYEISLEDLKVIDFPNKEDLTFNLKRKVVQKNQT